MRRVLPALCLVVIACGGCSSTEPLGLRYGPHRKVAEQRHDAQVFDPYALPGTGGDITGARPPDFDVPRSEPARTQDDRRWSIFGQ